MPGSLILCAGPIGNLGDAPPRLAEALGSVDVVYAEDTRRARVLLQHLGVDCPTRSYFVGNEADRSTELAQRLSEGATVALITDAGTPGIADPGLTAVRAAIEAGARITGVPGPSAVTLALAVSGLPADRFVFEGFLPRKGRRRAERIRSLNAEERTIVLFCAANRLAADLADLSAAGGDERPVVVCRELTKLYEEVWRGTLAEASAHWGAHAARGEVTLVVGGVDAPALDFSGALGRAGRLVDEGMSASAASRVVAEDTGVARRRIYEGLLALRRNDAGRED